MDEKILFQQFFEPFLGVSNLPLSGRSFQLTKTVYVLATREINKSLKKSKPNPKAKANELLPENLKDVLDLSDKCDDLKSDLRNVVDLFEAVDESRREFVDRFSDFKSRRMKLIDEFRDITSTWDYAVYRWNLTGIIRRTFIMAGGVAVFGPVLFPPLTSLAMIMPLAAGGISSAAAIYSWRTLARHGIIKDQRLQNAQESLRKDVQNVKRLRRWFDSSEELVTTLTDLLGGHTLDVMIRDWRHFLHQLKNSQMSEIWVAPLLKQWVKDVCSCWILQPKYGPDFTPVVLTFAFVVLFLQEKNVVLLECISRTRQPLVGRPRDVTKQSNSAANPKPSECEWERRRRVSENGGCENLLETSDLVGLARSLKEEAGFLQSIYCVLKMSLEEELACLSAFSTESEERLPSSMFAAEEQEKRSAIIIFNIPCSAKEDEVLPLVEALLPPSAKGTVKFLKIMGGLLGDNWVIEINKNHLPMLLKRKITVSDQTCPIDIYFGIFRCGKCQRFGHNVRSCEFEVACAECSENHSVKNCTEKKKKCINCVRFNEQNGTDFKVNHPVDGRKCQTYHNLKEHLRNGKSLKEWIKIAG